jgi:hypothetical protein
MASRITFKIDAKGKKVLNALIDVRFNRWQDALMQMGYSFRAGMAGIFANKAGRVNSRLVDGPNWKPLNAEYAAYKKKHAPQGVGTLVWYGGLGGSFIYEADPYNITRVGKMSAEFGSGHPLARFHQGGHSKGFYPARKIVFESEKRNAAFTQIMQDYLSAAIKGKGLKMERAK